MTDQTSSRICPRCGAPAKAAIADDLCPACLLKQVVGGTATDNLPQAVTSVVCTPEQLATFDGQFFLWRRKAMMLLDDRHLSFTRAGTTSIIPLAAVRDLSIGRYPRVMNPVGLNFISVTYDEGGQTKRLFFTPTEGLIGLPSTFNRFTADWFNTLRVAITTVTGHMPGDTPANQLGTPSSSRAMLLVMLLPPVVGLLLVGILAVLALRQPEDSVPNPAAPMRHDVPSPRKGVDP